jgi:hypothetical protein
VVVIGDTNEPDQQKPDRLSVADAFDIHKTVGEIWRKMLGTEHCQRRDNWTAAEIGRKLECALPVTQGYSYLGGTVHAERIYRACCGPLAYSSTSSSFWVMRVYI